MYEYIEKSRMDWKTDNHNVNSVRVGLYVAK